MRQTSRGAMSPDLAATATRSFTRPPPATKEWRQSAIFTTYDCKYPINTSLAEYARLTGDAKMVGPDEAADLRGRQLKAAMEHLEERRCRLAEVQCRILLAVDTGDVDALLILGLAIAASGEAARAAPILERVRRARPNHDDPCRDLETMQPRVPRSHVARQYRACLKL